MDWPTLSTRRANKDPIAQGGWSAFMSGPAAPTCSSRSATWRCVRTATGPGSAGPATERSQKLRAEFTMHSGSRGPQGQCACDPTAGLGDRALCPGRTVLSGSGLPQGSHRIAQSGRPGLLERRPRQVIRGTSDYINAKSSAMSRVAGCLWRRPCRIGRAAIGRSITPPIWSVRLAITSSVVLEATGIRNRCVHPKLAASDLTGAHVVRAERGADAMPTFMEPRSGSPVGRKRGYAANTLSGNATPNSN